MKLNSGRSNQKHRTRNDLIEAAAELMQKGYVPSLEEVADAAKVSRATAYRYFPTQEHILAGTIVLQANLEDDSKLQTAMASGDTAARLITVVEAFHRRFATHEVAYRALLRILLQPVAQDDSAEQPKVRASRQVHWLNEALNPLRNALVEEQYERLFAAIVSATSLEVYIALRDVCLLSPAEAGKIMIWTAQSILKAMMSELDEADE